MIGNSARFDSSRIAASTAQGLTVEGDRVVFLFVELREGIWANANRVPVSTRLIEVPVAQAESYVRARG